MLGALVLVAPGAMSTRAQDGSVPIELQVELLARVARYERGFAATPRVPAAVLVVTRPASPAAARVAGQIASHLARTREIAGRPVVVSFHEHTSAAALRALVERDRIAIVYFTSGLETEIPAIASALAGLAVITVSAIGSDVDRGAVLGFELAASRPRIVVNTGRARAQRLEFHSQFLRLARIVP